jgi:acetolactate synthase-1/2/3 large subunit
MSGAEALLRVLQEEDVDAVFGYPGAALIPIYDAMYRSQGRTALAGECLEPDTAGTCSGGLGMSQQTIRGAEALLKVLDEESADILFGFPGGQVIPIYDALYDWTGRDILVRHEQGAAHMADGYARSSGRVGVCLATSGPGALNLVTGIATAYMDSVPMVAITGQVKTAAIGKDSFQEADVTGVTIPVTKHNYLVTDPAQLVDIMREAFYIARTGRPGPVLVDIPSDISLGQVPFPVRNIEGLDAYEPPQRLPSGDIERAADMINASEAPILYIGGGVISSGAAPLIRELAEKANICVVHTLLGKGGFPETHSLSMGMPGMHGMAYASHAMQYAKLIVCIGARFDDRVTGDVKKFAPDAEIIHIDIDPAELHKVKRAGIAIAGDARAVLEVLVPMVKPRVAGAWEQKLEQWKAEHPLIYDMPAAGSPLPPEYVIEQLYEVTGGNAIVCTEVGQHQMWAAQYYKVDKPRHFLSSGGLGTMGYGFPAAIGAQFANPDALVIDIAGDGSIQMNIQEMATAVLHKLPVKIAIMNNGYLGMVRQWQDLFYDKRYSGVYLAQNNPDFVKLAEAYGGAGLRCERVEDVRATIEKSLEINDRPVIMDFVCAPEENVFPMIPAGKSVSDMLKSAPNGRE